MKDFYTRSLELLDTQTTIMNNIAHQLSLEFKISKKESNSTFHSLFNKTIKEKLEELLIPNKEDMISLILKHKSQESLKKEIPLNRIKGLYDKYFKVSTFRAVKLKLSLYRGVIDRVPTREDNFSLLISQHIGDGLFYFGNRSSFNIEHSVKQFEYLKFKVTLLNNAFPTLNAVGSISIKTRKIYDEDYTSCLYHSKTLRNTYMDKIRLYEKHELIKNITPLGLLLIYLDDGSLNLNPNSGVLHISIKDKKIRIEMIKKFINLGVFFRNSDNDGRIFISNLPDILKFMNVICLPYKDIIPKDMQYKIVTNI